MGAELTQDSQGFDQLVLTSGCCNNEENPDSYETLKILGFGDYDGLIKTKKVYSKLDKKVYIMKEIKINKSQGNDEDKILSNEEKNNLINILNTLKNDKEEKCENIIENIKFFTKGNYLYILDEYINNGDLLSYMKTYKDLNQPIKEETLWNIFLQCANGLKYLHSKNIIHRNIRLENIYMNDNKVIKIGNFVKAAIHEKKAAAIFNPFVKFNAPPNPNKNIAEDKRFKDIVGGVLYRSPEMANNSNYGKKTDIYSLGVVFHKLLFYDFPNSKYYKNKINNEAINFPKEMLEIIGKMLSEENNRPNAEELYDLIKVQYDKLSHKNTSIEAVLRCLNAYKKITKYLNENHTNFETTPFTKNYVKCIELFKSNNNKKKCGPFLNDIKNLMFNSDDSLNNDQEINPLLVLKILLDELHKETSPNLNAPSFRIWPFEIDNKEKAYNDFINYFSNNYKSVISKYFCGCLKIKRLCNQKKNEYCNYFGYNFYSSPYIEFQLDKCFRVIDNNICQFEPNIEAWFNIQTNHCKSLSEKHNIVCPKCNSGLNEFIQFEQFQKHLVIAINRGEGYTNHSKVAYNLKINLGKIIFDLVGVVKRISDETGEYFISISFDFDQNTWIISDKESAKPIINPLAHSVGDEVIFYYLLHENH